MPTPVQINFTDTQDIAEDLGPKSLGGALYVVASDPVSKIHVYKSTDNGATWTAQDTANAPSKASIAHTTELGWAATWHGTSVTVAYNVQGDTVYKLKTFNTATDTWGTASAAGPSENDSNTRDQTIRLVRDSSTGDFFLIFTEWLTTFQTIQYRKYSGGVWATQVELVGASGTIFNYISNACTDGSGNFHVFYRKCAVQGISGKPYHISFTPGGVISSEHLIDSTDTSRAFGKAIALTNTLLLGAYDSSDKAGVWVGTPISAPVWQFVQVDNLAIAGTHDIGDLSPTSAGPTYGGRSFLCANAGTVYLLFALTNGPTPDKASGGYTINRIYVAASTDGVTWSTPTVAYNEVTDPAPWVGALIDPDLDGITANIISGSLNLVANVNCEGVGFLGATSPPTPPSPITLICNDPPDGVVGTAYSHSFSVSGGTAPYTYSWGGYLVPGLTLNTSTGALTGTPVLAGTFVFTVVVTDSLSNTGNVTCSITITSAVPFTASCPPDTQAQIDVAFSTFISVSGGTTPYTFALTGGSLPTGLSLNTSTGEIHGTPTVIETSSYTITVTDSSTVPLSVQISCSIEIVYNPCPDLSNPQIVGVINPIDSDTELYLRRSLNDMNSAMTPSDQNA